MFPLLSYRTYTNSIKIHLPENNLFLELIYIENFLQEVTCYYFFQCDDDTSGASSIFLHDTEDQGKLTLNSKAS